jgi:SOS regulatory protein LexA
MKRGTQKENVFTFIEEYISLHGYGPAVREICEGLGLSSTATVHYHLRALEAAGRIVMEKGKKRAISLPGNAALRREAISDTARNDVEAISVPEAAAAVSVRNSEMEGLVREGLSRPLVPIVGTVAAGQPILAVENIDGWLPWEGGEGWFALRVKGESMKNAGILPGDKVVVRPQPTAEPGEIVVALLGDEATVKRFSRRGGQVWLLPENEAFSPIDGREAILLGVVRGVVREYD